jgi:hypothetical protein
MLFSSTFRLIFVILSTAILPGYPTLMTVDSALTYKLSEAGHTLYQNLIII